MEVRTKDGIVLKGIPDGTPESDIRARIDLIRSGNTSASPTEIKQPVSRPLDPPEVVSQKLQAAQAGLAEVPELSFAEKAAQAVLPEGGFSDETVDAASNVAAGATSMNRGIGNLIAGDDTFQPKPSPTGNPVDKSSLSYVGGQIADPTSWAAMGGIMKAGKAIPHLGKLTQLTPVAGKGKLLKIGRNVTAGAGTGAVMGALSEDGTATEGAVAGGVMGGVLPPVIQGVKSLTGGARNVLDTVGASFGKNKSIERLAKQGILKNTEGSRNKIIDALQKSKLDEINKVGPSTIKGYKQTVAEAIAKPQIGKPDQFGGSIIRLQKDLTGAAGLEDVLTGTARSQKAALLGHSKSLNLSTKPAREAALNAANKGGGVGVSGITAKIDEMAASPSLSKVARKSLKAIKKDIISRSADGKIDANALYTIRKEVGNTIKTYSKSTQNWDKRLTSGLERDIQKHIDTSIEGAGGVGWKDYLKTYAGGKREVSNAIAAQKEAKEIGRGVKSASSANLAQGQVPSPPTLLSRPMMALNYGLKAMTKDASSPVAREVAQAMQNPDKFAQYLKLPATNPLRKQAEQLMLMRAVTAHSGSGNE